jgi:predicted amino acid racemase
MFLKSAANRNRPLLEYAFEAHRSGKLMPDTYLLDMDAIRENSQMLLNTGKQYGVQLFFMLKQLGRNPIIAKMLTEMGFAGAVCVDFREAAVMLENHIPLGNVGHLVQTPRSALKQILTARPQIMTVYSVEKAREISDISHLLGFRQDIMLRVFDKSDTLYPGQYGGFWIGQLPEAIEKLEALPGIQVAGVCGFPCFLYDEKAMEVLPTPNLHTVCEAAKILEERGYSDLQVNLPSVTSVCTIPLIAHHGGTHGEPGHSLSGTTPFHKNPDCGGEIPAIVYVSEVSHNLQGKSYCYGGGYYRRSQLLHALVGNSFKCASLVGVTPPPLENIDYYLELEREAEVSQTVVMSFRSQIFVTRSEVAIISGLSGGVPRIEGIYSPLGHRLR